MYLNARERLQAAADSLGRPYFTLDIQLGLATWQRLRTELGFTGWADSGAALILHTRHGVLRCWARRVSIGSASPIVAGNPTDSDDPTST